MLPIGGRSEVGELPGDCLLRREASVGCRKVGMWTYCKVQLSWGGGAERPASFSRARTILRRQSWRAVHSSLCCEMGSQITPAGGIQQRYVPLASRAMARPAAVSANCARAWSAFQLGWSLRVQLSGV